MLFEPFGFGLLGLPFDSHHECILLKRLLHEKRVYRMSEAQSLKRASVATPWV